MSLDALHPDSVPLLKGLFRDSDASWPRGADLSFSTTLLADIRREGIGPLVWYFLGQREPCDWPEPTRLALHDMATQAVAVELLRASAVQDLLERFGESGIRPLLLKGTPLAYLLYPEPALRTRCDTDLLIPLSQREAVFELLEAQGYKGAYDAAAGGINAQVCFSRQAGGQSGHAFDVHWKLSNASRMFSDSMTYAGLSARAIDVPRFGDQAQTLGYVDALVFACFHCAGHYAYEGDRLIWLYDIHLLAQALSEGQAVEFADRARELRIGAICADALNKAGAWFGTRWPTAIGDLVANPPDGEDTFSLLEKGRMRGLRARARVDLQAMPGWRHRAAMLLGQAFPPPRYMAWRYGESRGYCLPWLYLKRFIEGIKVLLR